MLDAISPEEAGKLSPKAQEQRDWIIGILNHWIADNWPKNKHTHEPIHFEFKTDGDEEHLQKGVVENVIQSYKSRGWQITYSNEKSFAAEGWVWYHIFEVWK